MRFIYTTLMSGLLLVLFSSNLHAVGYPPPPPGPYIAGTQQKPVSQTPLDVLRAGIDQLQDFIASGEIYDLEKFEAYVNRQVKPFFDFEEMSLLVAGPYFKNMAAAEREQFKVRLEGMFLRAFMRQVSQHAGPQPQIDFLRPRFRGPDEVEALARVLFQDGSVKRLVFRFHRGDQGWKIYDVAANGTSAVLYYRRHFISQARQHGPDALLR